MPHHIRHPGFELSRLERRQRIPNHVDVEERVATVTLEVDDDELLATDQAVAGRAASLPRELVREAKATLSDMATIPTHSLAVERELGPQVWSLSQPFFAERLEALRKKIRKG